MKDNRLWWVLTLFSLSLNIGVIGYLVYLRLSPPPFPPSQPGPHYGFMERKHPPLFHDPAVKRFFSLTSQQILPLLKDQSELRRQIHQALVNGETAKAQGFLKTLYDRQREIDIRFINLAEQEFKEWPQEKKKALYGQLFRRFLGRRFP